ADPATAARGLVAGRRGAGAGAGPAAESGGQPRGPTTALPARRLGGHGELAPLSGPGRAAARRPRAADAALRAAGAGRADGGHHGRGPAAATDAGGPTGPQAATGRSE